VYYVALREISVLGNYVRPRSVQESHCHLAEPEAQIFHACAVAAKVKRVEILDFNMLATIVPFPCPELCARLALEQVACLNEGLAQAELVVATVIGKARIIGELVVFASTITSVFAQAFSEFLSGLTQLLTKMNSP
jgi:hypothetical protein